MRRLEENDTKIDKYGKKKKRLENEGKKVDESGSEMSSDEDNEKRPAGESKGIYATAGAEGKDKKDGKKKEDAVVEHGALKKT